MQQNNQLGLFQAKPVTVAEVSTSAPPVSLLKTELMFVSKIKVKPRVFKRPLKPSTIIDKTGYAPDRANDEDLITAYQYAQFGNALIRYPTYLFYTWSRNEVIYVQQRCGVDAIRRIIKELEERCLFDVADNNYDIDFKSIEQFIAKKNNDSKS